MRRIRSAVPSTTTWPVFERSSKKIHPSRHISSQFTVSVTGLSEMRGHSEMLQERQRHIDTKAQRRTIKNSSSRASVRMKIHDKNLEQIVLRHDIAMKTGRQV